MLIGTLVNTLTVFVGSFIGITLGRFMPKRVGQSVMKILGLCTVAIGCQGLAQGGNILIAVISLVLGTVIGEGCDIVGIFDRFLAKLEARFSAKKAQAEEEHPLQEQGGEAEGRKVSLSEGFVTASVLFCVGAMTIMGSLQDGLRQDHTILFTKAAMDFCSSLIFASTMGWGVFLAGFTVLVVQGSLSLCAFFLAPFMQEAAITEVCCVGNILLIALGLNVIGITNFKMLNHILALLFPVLIIWLMNQWG